MVNLSEILSELISTGDITIEEYEEALCNEDMALEIIREVFSEDKE